MINHQNYHSCEKRDLNNPLHWVDPNIGTVSFLLEPAVPIVQMPHGMIRITPTRLQTHPDPWLSDYVTGFPLNIISHRGERAFSIMPLPGLIKEADEYILSESDHDMESAAPYEFSLTLSNSMIKVLFSVSETAMIYRFVFTRPDVYSILFSANVSGHFEISDETQTISGCERLDGIDCYFYARSDKPFHTYHEVSRPASLTSVSVSYAAHHTPYTVELRIGFSFIDISQACDNMMREVDRLTFSQISVNCQNAWNSVLNRIVAEGGTESQRRVFYTALWRCHERPVCITEQGRYYSSYDNNIHDDTAPFYVDDWIWDTFRTLHPLRIILDPEKENEILNSYAKIIKQGAGWAPVFPLVNGNKPVMIGNHLAAVVADAYCKGLHAYDINALYNGLRKNSTEGSRIPWYSGPATELDILYLQKGFFPALLPGQKETIPQVHPYERRQSVSVTLEHAYDDWCLSELSAALGKSEEAEVFRKRSLNYRNLFHEESCVMAPRSADGSWIFPFDPGLSGGTGGREYYTECNGWVWTWSVPHDIAGLIKLFGGRKAFADRLDHLFNQSLSTAKYNFFSQFPDATGLIGQYPAGNEPGFLIPYLYLYAGFPWKTQKRVRQIMAYCFDDSIRGLSGDDDGGALSSWYVFSAMGFYPLCPGRPVYGIGSPIFKKTCIRIGRGVFTIEAKNTSAKNKYVQSAKLNGRELTHAWFEHSSLIEGGSLVLVMGERPNFMWGCREEDVPPSLSSIS